MFYAKTATATPVVEGSTKEFLCNRTVKYSIEKSIVTMETGEEREDNRGIEMIVNLNDGRFTMITSPEDKKAPWK
jgi:hypothetical protein